MKFPPISRSHDPRAERLYQVRPPIRSRASTSSTLRPPVASSRAAVTPAKPTPTTTTSWISTRASIAPGQTGRQPLDEASATTH